MIKLNTPWRVEETNANYLRDSEDEYISIIEDWQDVAPSLENMYAIVHRVNAYPMLIEELRSVLQVMLDNGISECEAYDDASALLQALVQVELQEKPV